MPLDSYYLYKKRTESQTKMNTKSDLFINTIHFFFLFLCALISVIKVKGHECNDLHNNNLTKKKKPPTSSW